MTNVPYQNDPYQPYGPDPRTTNGQFFEQSPVTPTFSQPPAYGLVPQDRFSGDGWGQPMVPMVTSEPHPMSLVVLVLGLLSFFFAPIAAIGLFIGSSARSEVHRYPTRYSSSPALTAGWAICLIVTILMILGLLLLVMIFLAIGL